MVTWSNLSHNPSFIWLADPGMSSWLSPLCLRLTIDNAIKNPAYTSKLHPGSKIRMRVSSMSNSELKVEQRCVGQRYVGHFLIWAYDDNTKHSTEKEYLAHICITKLLHWAQACVWRKRGRGDYNSTLTPCGRIQPISTICTVIVYRGSELHLDHSLKYGK